LQSNLCTPQQEIVFATLPDLAAALLCQDCFSASLKIFFILAEPLVPTMSAKKTLFELDLIFHYFEI
jgi:hypothetical protein